MSGDSFDCHTSRSTTGTQCVGSHGCYQTPSDAQDNPSQERVMLLRMSTEPRNKTPYKLTMLSLLLWMKKETLKSSTSCPGSSQFSRGEAGILIQRTCFYLVIANLGNGTQCLSTLPSPMVNSGSVGQGPQELV